MRLQGVEDGCASQGRQSHTHEHTNISSNGMPMTRRNVRRRVEKRRDDQNALRNRMYEHIHLRAKRMTNQHDDGNDDRQG